MRCCLVVMSLFVVACSGETGPQGAQGTAGAQGAQGPEGAQGSAGQPGRELAWADATGTVIPGVYGNQTGDGASPIYIDPQTGYVWRIDIDHGLLSAVGGARVWTTTDCTGTPSYWLYINNGGNLVMVAPRVVVEVTADEYRVRKDDVMFSGLPPDWGSIGDPAACSDIAPTSYGLTAAQTNLAVKPTLTLTPPLHPVLTSL